MLTADTLRYQVTTHENGSLAVVLDKENLLSAALQGDDATKLWDALNESRCLADDDRVLEWYDDVMRYDEREAARYRRDQRRRAYQILQDAGVDSRGYAMWVAAARVRRGAVVSRQRGAEGTGAA